VIDRRVVAFVRMQPERSAAVNERDVLAAVAASLPRNFSVPEVLGAGAAGGWEWIATAPLPTHLHRGDWTSDPYAIGSEISASLGTVLGPAPRAGWVPIHGDLAPWNLRRSGRRTVLIDWESVDHGPPAADAVYLVANRAAMRGHLPDTLNAEAARFWLDRLEQRAGSGLDQVLTSRLNDIFRRFAS
jgi:Ser/Thr protein kinase RdoA (MazF antagonist)